MRKNIIIITTILSLVILGCSKRTRIIDFEVPGVKKPLISLNGTWKFSMSPAGNFWDDSVDFQNWSDIQVPGECQMQGFAIKHDKPYVYKQVFMIPEDFEGKRVYLNFYGVYSYARVWVNGKFAREHYGGFTKWSCEITEHISSGDSAILTIEMVDRMDDISYGSGYAKHQIGGILRDVELIALPKLNFKKLWYETHLDEKYENAHLKVSFELSQNTSSKIKVELYNEDNRLIESSIKKVTSQIGEFNIPVKNPKKWDAEHPNLYKVVTSLLENGNEILKIPVNIGFREVEIEGNKLLVNGKPVKLRGTNRHDIHPLLGRMTTAEYDKMDVLLAKEANINFIRTSHYPPSKAFLDYCDKYGIYVEDETAVCFVGTHRIHAYQASGASQNDPEFTDKYLSQVEEMIQNHRNHPSVIIWSIGNENVFGNNFNETYNWVMENDLSRPVIYSYPGHVPDSVKLYDILSMHYPGWKGGCNQYGISIRGFDYEKMPVLFDEWAHIPTYCISELRDDPNVRNFWGQSLDSMWTNLFDTEGGLGGSIWCMIDETFMLPQDLPGFNDWWGIIDPDVIPPTFMRPCVGYGEWGIVDCWRRKKPEFWLTKKAYSPTKIYLNQIDDFLADSDLSIPIHNRFDHTDFSEIKITWKYGSDSGQLKNVQLGPHLKGKIIIPANNWNSEEKLNICFFKNDTFLIDEYNLQLGERKIELPVPKTGSLVLEETGYHIKITGEKFVLHVNKKSGLLENVMVKGEILIKSGPYINLKLPGNQVQFSTYEINDWAENWICHDFRFEENRGIATIYTTGVYDSISAGFIIQLDPMGLFTFDYFAKDIPEDKNIQEAGLKFITGDSFDKLGWERNSYFSAYPQGHLGNPKDETNLNKKLKMKYREKPQHDWEMDIQSFYYFGLDTELPYTNHARSLKENIYSFYLKTQSNSIINVFSDGTQAGRFDKIKGENTIIINDQWDYASLLWGNYMKLIESEKELRGKVILKVQ